MNIDPEKTVGQLVLDYPEAAEVFERYGIDFCCNGTRTLTEACMEQQLEPGALLTALAEHRPVKEDAGAPAFQSWPLDLLADYIEKKHHRYVAENLPLITRYLEKIVSVHGSSHPELSQVNTLFRESAGELTRHMKKEELILFPFIRKLVKLKTAGQSIDASAAGAMEQPVRMMMHDHSAEGERFRKIATLTHQYTPPQDGCATYQSALSKLKEFEKDLHQHIHLENNLLFPGAIAMEKELVRQQP